jgi:hypothetical protein
MEMESRPASHAFFTPHQKQIVIGEELKKEAPPPYLSFSFSGMDTKRGGACICFTRRGTEAATAIFMCIYFVSSICVQHGRL